MLAKYRDRGLAYECIRCGKIDRHSRMVAHVLKHHIPLDRSPYYCTMCGFRSQDQQKLLDHVTKYAPHREEEAKRGKPKYEDVLRKALNPVFITDQELRPLGREESYQWYASNNRSNQVDDDDEVLSSVEEAFERVHRSGNSIPSSPEYTKRPSLSSSMASLSQTGLSSTARRQPSMSYVSTTTSAVPTAASSSSNILPGSSLAPTGIYQPTLAPVPLSTSVSAFGFSLNSSAGSVPVFLSDQPPVYKPTHIAKLRFQEVPFDQPAVGQLKTSASATPGLINAIQNHTVSQQQSSAEIQTTSTAGELKELLSLVGAESSTGMSHPTGELFVATPLQDEDVLELTPDDNDPLLIEAEKLSKPVESSANITSAIVNGFASIVEAINANTSAIRQHGKVFENVVGELTRIERKICGIERALNAKSSQTHPQPLMSNTDSQSPCKKPRTRRILKT